MKPERGFIAERALAVHCPQLLRAAPPPGDLLPLLGLAGRQITRALGPLLAPLLAGEAPEVTAEPAQSGTAAALIAQIGSLAANSLLAVGSEAAPMLVSIEAEAVFRMVDRAFGGRGAVPVPLPAAFPLSAELMMARLEGIAVTALAQGLGLSWPGAVRPLRRDSNLAALAPFADCQELAVQTLTVTEPGGASWSVTLALPLDALAGLLGSAAKTAPPAGKQRSPANPADAPFGALPLCLSAVLIDMAMPVSVIAELVVGQILPVSVARSVPLRLGNSTIAHGTIGALDERVAVQITHAF